MDTVAQPHYPRPGENISEDATFTLLPEGFSPQETTVLFVHAHPDDESSSTGATIAALVEAGARVELITMTRGEMGEVIDPQLKHLEASHPSNKDGGQALGQCRSEELEKALEILGVHRHFYLGQGPSAIEDAPQIYRDSGMAWGEDGRPVPNPAAPADCLTAQDLELQVQAMVAAIQEIRPDIIVSYDADGGYGHPDHKRTYEVVSSAVHSLAGTPYAPTALWGLEGDYNPHDTRPQAVIMGKLEPKREAMRAHATQISITGPSSFEYSNQVPQPISALETYRLIWGLSTIEPVEDPYTEINNDAPGVVNSAVTALAVGLISGFTGTMYHTYIWYSSSGFWFPWGLALALLTVFSASLWAALYTEKNWAAALVGSTAFILTGIFALARDASMLIYLNPINPVGITGTLWALGTLVVSIISIMVATRYRRR